MGQKVNPIGLRLGITRTWDSIWFAQMDEYKKYLHEDIMIRTMIGNRFKKSGIIKIIIERFPGRLNVSIHTARPGVVIGQKGARIESLKNDIKKEINTKLHVGIVGVKKTESVAQAIADTVAQQLEKRIPFRRVMKQALRGGMRSGLEGIKITVAGRLNGADMARSEQYKDGRVPLHTLRANVEYAFSQAETTYGIIGVKIWTYHGDILPGKEDKEEDDFLVRPVTA